MRHWILPRIWWLSLACVLGGCQTRPAEPNHDLTDAGRAARARFDELHAAHRVLKTPAEFKLLPITRPERREDGIVYVESTEFIRLPTTL